MTDADFELITDWPVCKYTVVGLVIQDKLGRTCLQLRDNFAHVNSGGKWGFFGGHVDAGESIEMAAARELTEETGLVAAPSDLIPYVRMVPADLAAYHYYFRLNHVVEPHQINVFEGAGFAFFEEKQAKSLKKLESATLMWRHLYS